MAASMVRTGGLVTAGVLLAALLLTACSGGAAPLTVTQDIRAGVAAQGSGKLVLAASYYAKALALRPTSATALFDLGDVEQLQQLAAASAAHYRAALAADPTYVPALYNLATLLATTKPLESEALYRDVVRLAPRNADAHFNLGFVLLSLDHTAAGTRQITVATALDPSLRRRLPRTLHALS